MGFIISFKFRYEDIFKRFNLPHRQVRLFSYLIGREISDLKHANWMACNNRGTQTIFCCKISYLTEHYLQDTLPT